MKPQFVPSLHAFRGFAIANIVAAHAFTFVCSYAVREARNPPAGAGIVSPASEILFHDSTLYFALISGLLYSMVLAARGWPAFFRSKLLHVFLPYFLFTCLFTWSHWEPDGTKTLFDGDVASFMLQVQKNLVSGDAIFIFWYIPVLLMLYMLTPLFAWLVEANRFRWAVAVIAVAPLVLSRTWPEKSWTTVAYFSGAYILGILGGANYQRTIAFVSQRFLAITAVGGLASLALAVLYSVEIDNWGFVSLRETAFYLQKIAVAAIFLLAFERSMRGVPRWLDVLGDYAFPIYFMHGYLLYVTFKLANNLAVRMDTPWLVFLYGVASFTLVTAACLLVAFIFRKGLGRGSRYLIGA